MSKGFSILISVFAASILVLGLTGCDRIPVYDPSKVNWPDRMPWQRTQQNVPNTSIPESNTGYPYGQRTATSPYPYRGRGDYINYPEMRRFIGEMSRKHNFQTTYLERIFSTVKRNDAVLGKVRAPAEGKAWRAYRPIFLTEERIKGGVDFWHRHRAALDAAARKYGVEPEYIVAIIGVETFYGRTLGNYNVLQSLTTLAFDYPKRSNFYRKELEQFLLLTREERVDPNSLRGSYAGAMGMSQFISSSYRNFAVDFNRDGKRDLWRADDAIGSVANYLAKHGWKRGGAVAIPASVTGQAYSMADTTAKKPRYTMSQLRNAGVRINGNFWSRKVNLLKLVGTRDSEYWVTGENFYVITRYNHSPKYAMAVHQLAREIRRRY